MSKENKQGDSSATRRARDVISSLGSLINTQNEAERSLNVLSDSLNDFLAEIRQELKETRESVDQIVEIVRGREAATSEEFFEKLTAVINDTDSEAAQGKYPHIKTYSFHAEPRDDYELDYDDYENDESRYPSDHTEHPCNAGDYAYSDGMDDNPFSEPGYRESLFSNEPQYSADGDVEDDYHYDNFRAGEQTEGVVFKGRTLYAEDFYDPELSDLCAEFIITVVSELLPESMNAEDFQNRFKSYMCGTFNTTCDKLNINVDVDGVDFSRSYDRNSSGDHVSDNAFDSIFDCGCYDSGCCDSDCCDGDCCHSCDVFDECDRYCDYAPCACGHEPQPTNKAEEKETRPRHNSGAVNSRARLDESLRRFRENMRYYGITSSREGREDDDNNGNNVNGGNSGDTSSTRVSIFDTLASKNFAHGNLPVVDLATFASSALRALADNVDNVRTEFIERTGGKGDKGGSER